MSEIEYKKIGGPYGDATSSYEIITDAKTVGELIDALLPKDNFATFCLRATNRLSKEDICVCKAQDHKIIRKAKNYNSLASMKLKEVKANGGWGSMLYDITIEGELPKQDRKEFEMVYWGYTF